jgi:hypothetical protein
MSDDDKSQGMLLLAIEYLEVQYQFLQNPCIALLISRQYRLLANSTIEENQQGKYADHSKSWLTFYITHQNHSQKMQNQLNDLVLLRDFNSLTL